MDYRNPDVARRVSEAHRITQKKFNNKVYIRGIVEFSNYCRKNCNYCGIHRENSGVKRYRMSADEIVAAAENNLKQGIKTVVLQSGEDMSYSRADMVDIIQRIKAIDPECPITLSFGERSREDYAAFKEAGADRFLMRFETADRELFASLHPDDDFDAHLNGFGFALYLGHKFRSGFFTSSFDVGYKFVKYSASKKEREDLEDATAVGSSFDINYTFGVTF